MSEDLALDESILYLKELHALFIGSFLLILCEILTLLAHFNINVKCSVVIDDLLWENRLDLIYMEDLRALRGE